MKTASAALCSIALAIATTLAGAAEAIPFSAALAPGEMHEECMKLGAGDKRAYYWKATAPVDFNVHYHEGAAVSYPVKRDAMRGDGGTFVAKEAQDYCWMWTARDKPAKLEGRIEAK
ncbi:MAG: hypothetical protein ACXWG1_05880 [Usitatibacter sp.]